MIERIEINLLPAEYRVHRQQLRIQREILYPALGVGLIFVALWWVTISLGSQISQKQQNIASIEQGIQKNSQVRQEIEQLKSDRKVIEDKIVALERISVNREKWVRLMEIFCGRIPRFSWLTSLEEKAAQSPPQIVIKGNTFSFPEVANFMSKLAESDYITAVDLSTIEQITTPTKNYAFSLTGTVNPDARITKPFDETEKGR
jgi:Tfp pilus assembly protein PilN